MGVIKKFEENNCLIGIWDTQESLEELLLLSEKIDLSKFETEKRKKEFLVSRLLLKEIHPNQQILYNKYGAPEIRNGNQISISHSKNLAAIASSKHKVGLDIEQISVKPLQLSSKFISKDTCNNLSKEKATLIWCCKEAIFKWHQKGNIDFKNDIKLKPFILGDDGKITTIFKNKEHTLYYKKVDTHFLVYVCN